MKKLHRCTFQCPDDGYWIAARFENGVVTLEPFEEDRELSPEGYDAATSWCESRTGHRCKTVDDADEYLWSLGCDRSDVAFDDGM